MTSSNTYYHALKLDSLLNHIINEWFANMSLFNVIHVEMNEFYFGCSIFTWSMISTVRCQNALENYDHGVTELFYFLNCVKIWRNAITIQYNKNLIKSSINNQTFLLFSAMINKMSWTMSVCVHYRWVIWLRFQIGEIL